MGGMNTQPCRRMRATSLVVLLLCLSWFVRGQDTMVVFTGPPEVVIAGTRPSIWLTVLNQSNREISWTFPVKIDCRLVATRSVLVSALELRESTETGQVTIEKGAFARREYLLPVPSALGGPVVVEFPSLGANRVVLDVEAPTAVAGETEKKKKAVFAKFLQEGALAGPGEAYNPGQFFKDHISGYEPFYFIAGTESPNAKFQISFKYQLVNSHGWLADHASALEGFHFGYTQTSLWDWNAKSAPFFDSSYKPELLYSLERVLGGKPTNWFRLDLQGGLQHESNGKGGADSRSMNIAYLRPTFIFGHDDGLQLTLQPRAWVYVGDLSDNPDMADYRGYADLRVVVGWQRGVQLAALGRIGDHGNHESLQLDLTYPLMKLLSDSFTVYLHAQYFTGYGESLLGYKEKESSFRIGFALYR